MTPFLLLDLAAALDAVIDRLAKAGKPDDSRYRHVLDAADRKRRAMISTFLAAVRQAQADVDLAAVERALAKGDGEAAIGLVDWTALAQALGDGWTRQMRAVFAEAALAGAKLLPGAPHVMPQEPARDRVVDAPPRPEIFVPPPRPPRRRPSAASAATPPTGPQTGHMTMSLNLTNHESVRWIDAHGADLVREVSDSTRDALRSLVRDAYVNGGHPKATARKMRQHIGLTERQSQSVINYADRLLADGSERPDRIDGKVDRYAGKVLRDRAETIARTETLTAAHRGQQSLWQQATEQGLLSPERTRRRWIVTPDDRLCPLCAEMVGDRAETGLDEPFDFPGGPVTSPPGHPRCRCAMALVVQSRAEAAGVDPQTGESLE